MYTSLVRSVTFICLVSATGLAGCGSDLKSTAGSVASTGMGTTTNTETSGPEGVPPSPSPSPAPSPSPTQTPAPSPKGTCGLQTAGAPLAFCETFDAPSAVFNRSGQLNGLVWGTSRLLSEVNIGQPFAWTTSQLDVCGVMQTVSSPNDVQICNGQLRQVTNDNHAVSTFALYPKQQFDFSGRVGTVAFDVTNDTKGTHAAWPEFWMSDQPVPAPFNHFGSWVSVPVNGFGVRFGAFAPPGQFGICPNGDDINSPRFTVDSAVIVRDWRYEDVYAGGGSQCMDGGGYGQSCVMTGTTVELKGCVKAPNGPNGGMNHIELKVSQNQIDVYATDAGTKAPLKLIATITKANLSLSRGFVWIQDAHYNASKGPAEFPLQTNHTFAWDNVAFDGPLVARERSFDVLESRVPMATGQYLGWNSTPGQPANLSTIPIPAADLLAAKTGALLFNFYHYDAPASFTYKINGREHVVAWPFPDRQGYTARTISLPIPLNELVMGANQISIGAEKAMAITNVSVSLQGAGGIVNP